MKTYDFKQVACVVGANLISGYAEGDDSIMIEKLSESWTMSIGADGESTRSKTNNNGARITLKLNKSSDSNDILNGFYQADKLSNGGLFPFLVKDNNGRELHLAEQCFIEKAPDPKFGSAAGEREWILLTGELTDFHGGN